MSIRLDRAVRLYDGVVRQSALYMRVREPKTRDIAATTAVKVEALWKGIPMSLRECSPTRNAKKPAHVEPMIAMCLLLTTSVTTRAHQINRRVAVSGSRPASPSSVAPPPVAADWLVEEADGVRGLMEARWDFFHVI